MLDIIHMSKQLNTIEYLAERLGELTKEASPDEQTILQIIKDLGTELLSNLAEKNVGKDHILHDFSFFIFIHHWIT